MKDTGDLKANRLAKEKSPYLLQHQFNPVDWHAWGDEAFARARQEDKPVFLSIGYSTCHWCHVMERESFEDPRVAAILNEHFVSIKVDREERPDVDKIYMTFVQATTGQGGWPLSAFLTSDRKPFFGGTYFPPSGRYGRPGFSDLLQQIAQVWKERREDVEGSARDIHEKLGRSLQRNAEPGGPLDEDTLRKAVGLLMQHYDHQNGGFGGAPKFPQPSHPQFVLRCGRRYDQGEAVRMVLHTCDRMAAGGIHDQLGGGFARYAVDAQWLVPHFEKMLYDNAQLVHLYLEAFLVSGNPRYAQVARDTLDYVLRDMTHPQGGFYSAEDADSEGHEGKYYCWTENEVRQLLTPEEFTSAQEFFGITREGNFVDHSHPSPLQGQNVLSIVNPSAAAETPEALSAARRKLFEARAKRIRPGVDDKVLASWNGLMLGAMARAGVVLREPAYALAAVRNADFLHRVLWVPGEPGTLYHRWRDGEPDNVEILEGYAFLLSGLLELYEATLDPSRLDFAIRLANAMLHKFYDPANGGFWQSPAGLGDLIFRLKEDYDGAEPSGNSVAILALLKLGKITGDNTFTEAGRKSLEFFAEKLNQTPQALPHMLQAVDFMLLEPYRAVITGRDLADLLHAAHSVYQPNKVVLGTSGPVEEFARTLASAENTSKAYVCNGTSCQPPTGDAGELRRMLAG